MAADRPERPGPTASSPRLAPVAAGEAVFGLRRGRWLLHVVLAAALLFGLVALSHRALWRSAPWTGVAFGLLAVAVTACLSGLLAQALAVQRAGGVLHLDAHGIRHCQLPLLSWRDVHGVDLRARTRRGGERWTLVLALAPQAAVTMRFAAWRFWLDASLPRVDAAGRLALPLLSVDAEPEHLADLAVRLADRSGAPRISGWRHDQDPTPAVARSTAPTQHDAARQAHALFERLRAAGGAS